MNARLESQCGGNCTDTQSEVAGTADGNGIFAQQSADFFICNFTVIVSGRKNAFFKTDLFGKTKDIINAAARLD